MLRDDTNKQKTQLTNKKASRQYSAPGRNRLKLISTLIRLAPKLIEYAKKVSKKMKRRNSHQILLFPESNNQTFTYNPNQQSTSTKQIVNYSLIRQYRSKDQNWYDFYFQANKMFIDNHHLQIFNVEKPIKFNKTSSIKFGKIIFFGEKIASSNIDIKNNTKLPQKYDTTLFLGTQSGQIIILETTSNAIGFLKLTNQKLNSISYSKDHLLAFTKNTAYVVSYKLSNSKQIKINLLYFAQFQNQKMSRVQFISEKIQQQTIFYLFYINQHGLWRVALKPGIFSNKDKNMLIQASPQFNPFTNMKAYYIEDQKRVIITVTCTKQAIILSHHARQCKTSILHKMQNPKNPPSIPKVHIYNQQEKVQTQIIEAYQSQAYHLHKGYILLGYGRIIVKYQKELNFHRESIGSQITRIKEPPLQQQEGKQQKPDKQPQKLSQTVKIQFILTRLSEILSFSLPVIVPCINKVDYQSELQIPRFTFTTKGFLYDNLCVKITMFNNKEILIMKNNQIARISLKNWKDIYVTMLKTQNIQLLYYLIVVQNYYSTFFDIESTIDARDGYRNVFRGLEKFFPMTTPLYKQLLLQYYYQTNQQPPIQFIAQIQNNTPQLLLPFILHHKINNLSDHSQQLLVQYYRKKDKRVVQQLIISGVEYGWEIAVQYGWMRALRKMVEMGMEIHFPILKISSFIIASTKQLQGLKYFLEEQEEQSSEKTPSEQNSALQNKIQKLQKQIQNYSKQIIDYSLLALNTFLQPQQIDDLQDMKQFLLALLRQQTFTCLIKYCPKQSIKLLSKIFSNTQTISLIQKQPIQNFLHLSKIYKNLLQTPNVSICEIIYSHISQSYRQLTQNKTLRPPIRLQCRHLLFIEHAKLIQLKYQSHVNIQQNIIPIVFIRSYLIQMLYVLTSNDNQDVKIMIRDQRNKIESSKIQIQCYIQDFLVCIWQQAKISPIQASQQNKHNKNKNNNLTQEMNTTEMKQIMNTLEQINNSNCYLLIKIMETLSENDYCAKILKRYIQSNNVLIRVRIFPWILSAFENNKQTCLKIIQSQLMLYLPKLIEIDKQKARKIFDLLYAQKQRQIIQQIDNDPNLQLQYLQMIINDTKDDAKDNIQQNFLNLHIKLLIRQQPERVIEVLQDALRSNIKYDLHQALKISLDTQQYPEKNKIQTYLFEKVGEVQKCIKSYLKMLGQIFWKYAEINQQNYQLQRQKSGDKQNNSAINKNSQQYTFDNSRKTTKKLTIISEILSSKKYSQANSKSLELQQQMCLVFRQMQDLVYRQPVKKYDYIALPLNAMNTFFDQIKVQQLKNKEHFDSILIFYFGSFIFQAFEKGYIKHFTHWIKKTQKLNLSGLKKHLQDSYHSVIRQQKLLQNISQIDQNVLVKNIQDIVIVLQKNIFSQARCFICGLSFGERQVQNSINNTKMNNKNNTIQQDGLLFNCGHICHKQCIQEDENGQDYCWQCIYNNQIKAMIENVQISLVKILERYCYKKSIHTGGLSQKQPIKKQAIISTHKKRVQRMGIFDKKVNTLENQVTILDMKLQIMEYYDSQASMIVE